MSEEQLYQLISLCPNVTRLISNNAETDHNKIAIYNKRLALIAKSMPKLKSIRLTNYHITDFSPVFTLKNLNHLHLNNSHIADLPPITSLNNLIH